MNNPVEESDKKWQKAIDILMDCGVGLECCRSLDYKEMVKLIHKSQKELCRALCLIEDASKIATNFLNETEEENKK